MNRPHHHTSSDLDALLAEADWIVRIARSLVNDEHAALDLSQDVLTDALQAPPALREGRLRAWLWTIARRKAARRNRREHERSFVETQGAGPESGTDDAASERVQLHVELAKEIQALEPEDRRVLVGFFLEGQNQKQLARQEGCAPAALRKRVSRAKSRLRARLDASKRGPGGWTAGLLFLSRTPGAPSGVAEGGSSTTGDPAASLTSLAQPLALPWLAMKISLTLAGTGLLTLGAWHALTPSESVARSDEVAELTLTPTLDAPTVPMDADANVSAVNVQPGVARSAATAREVTPGGPLPRPAVSRRIQIIDRGGTPIPRARAIWLTESGSSAELEALESGIFELVDPSAGRLFVAASDHMGRMVRLESAEGLADPSSDTPRVPASMTVTLQPPHEFVGQITVDGLAPSRPLEFRQWVVERKMGFSGDEESSAPGYLRWLGLETDRWLRSDESGRFQFSLDWEWPAGVFWLPAEFLVRSINAVPVNGQSGNLELSLDAEHHVIDLKQLPAIRGRLEWSDDHTAVTGNCEFYLENERGDTRLARGILTPDGRFSISPIIPGSRLDAALVDLERMEYDGAPLEFAARMGLGLSSLGIRLEERWEIDRQENSRDLGVIMVPRHPKVDVLVRGLPKGHPVKALLRGSLRVQHTGENGRASVAVEAGGRLEAIAMGYRHVSRVVTAAEIEQGQTLVIDLAPAPVLAVRAAPTEANDSEPVVIRLEFDVTPFETAQLDEQGRGTPYDYALQKALQGNGWVGGGYSHQEPGAPGYADFEVPRSGELRIGGMLPGHSVRVHRLGPDESFLVSRTVEIAEGLISVNL